MQHFISGLRGLVTFRQWCTSEPSWVVGVRVEEVRSWWSAPPLVSHSGSSRQGSTVFFRTASLTGKVSCSPHRFRTYCLAITAGRQDVLLWNEIYSKVKKEWCKTQNLSRYFCLTFFFFFSLITFFIKITFITLPSSNLCGLYNHQHTLSPALQQLWGGQALHGLHIVQLFTFKPIHNIASPHISDLLPLAQTHLSLSAHRPLLLPRCHGEHLWKPSPCCVLDCSENKMMIIVALKLLVYIVREF